MAILSLQNINKSFGDKKANDNISLEVRENSIFGMLGPNGAGKTTLIRIITNIMVADSGSITLNGQPLGRAHNELIGYMPEERGLYKKMKVGEHLIYLARLKNLSKKVAKEKVNFWLEKFNITDWYEKRVEELSKGMQQKVQFIATVINDPKLLILDEPFSGLDPINTNLLKDEIQELKRKGTAIIFSTHRMEQVEEICEDIALINNGRNILSGSVRDIRERFKENLFSISYKGALPELNGRLNIVQQKDHELIIKMESGQSPNDALKYCIEHHIEVHGFKEILPAINEIFIKEVQKSNG
ncbi:MAG: ATP-binding cassette domain-containing protein [Chitinophagales bacterium]|nr:ATP-binding cassette domain-containing protein [Chitinophagales bacterium]